MSRALLFSLVIAVVLALAGQSAACGSDDETSALKTQVSALQTQVAQPTPTTAATSAPTPPPTLVPTATATATAVPPTPTARVVVIVQPTAQPAPTPRPCTYIVIASTYINSTDPLEFRTASSTQIRDRQTGAVVVLKTDVKWRVGFCYPEGYAPD
jgi:hypothetical protein